MIERPHAIVVMGVSGSGKTTVALGLAGHYGYAFVDADDLHSIDAKAQMAAGMPLTDEQREPWVLGLVKVLQESVAAGLSPVLAFSGLRSVHRQKLRESGVPVRFIFLYVAPARIQARLLRRTGHYMPPSLLASQFEALQSSAGERDVLAVDGEGPPEQVLARVIAVLEAS